MVDIVRVGDVQSNTYALINANGLVVNIVAWDGETAFTPDGVLVKCLQDVRIGDSYDGAVFTAPGNGGA